MYKVNERLIVCPDEDRLIAKVVDPVHKAQIKLCPNIDTLEAEDNSMLVSMPWSEEACKLLLNIGVDPTAASPFMFTKQSFVEGKYMPMAHQLLTAAFITFNPRCYVLNDPRTGKTGSLILGMDYLQRKGIVKGAFLIITTVTTLHGVWKNTIETTLPGSLIQVAHGKNRETALEIPSEFIITNYDSVRLIFDKFKAAVKEGRIGGVVIDELTHVGNTSSQRHEKINKLVNKLGIRHVIGVTGSPGEDPEPVFGMCKIVNPGKLPVDTKYAWMNLVTYQWGSAPYQRSMTRDAPTVIYKAMQPAIRFRKEDILDLPPVVTQDRTCEMSLAQKKHRQQLKNEAIAMLDSGEVITASNGGVLHQKLMQVAQGFCMTTEGVPITIDHAERTKTIIEAIAETQRKTVVFCYYKAAIKQTKKELEAAGYTVGVVDGSITGKERAAVLNAFQNEKDPHVLVCHPTTTAYGVELAVADTIIFNGPPMLGGFIFAQALERLSSNKQTAKKISIIRIMSTPEEKRAFDALDNGRKLGDIVSALFEDLGRGNL